MDVTFLRWAGGYPPTWENVKKKGPPPLRRFVASSHSLDLNSAVREHKATPHVACFALFCSIPAPVTGCRSRSSERRPAHETSRFVIIIIVIIISGKWSDSSSDQGCTSTTSGDRYGDQGRGRDGRPVRPGEARFVRRYRRCVVLCWLCSLLSWLVLFLLNCQVDEAANWRLRCDFRGNRGETQHIQHIPA